MSKPLLLLFATCLPMLLAVGPRQASLSAAERPTFSCSKSRPGRCQLEVVLTLDKLRLFKAHKIDFSLYRDDRVVYRVDAYKIKSLTVDRERGIFVSRMVMQGDWQITKDERRRVIRDTVLARSQDIEL